MVKTDYTYQTKRKYHRTLREAIARGFSNPSGLRVLCLPGAGAREILEVYDRLGIQRKNIVGCERERGVYDELERQNLGIELYRGEVLDFLTTTNHVFDLVSLDYTQLPGEQTLDPVLTVTRRHLLSGRSMIHTNFYASRVSDFVLRSLPILRSREVVVEGGNQITRSSHITGSSKDTVEDLRTLKDYGITGFILAAIYGDEMLTDTLMRRNLGRNEERVSELKVNKFSKGKLDARKRPYKDGFATQAFVSTFYKEHKPYLVTGLEKFCYVSDDGSLMMSDIFSIRDFAELFEEVKKYFGGISVDENGVLHYDMIGCIHVFKKQVRNFGRIIGIYDEARKISAGYGDPKNQPPRIDITPREELDSELAIKLLRSGWTYRMFEDRFKDVTPARIAAYRAHITMGTYEKKETTGEDKKTGDEPRKKVLKESKRTTLKRGVLFFDSDFRRLRKNLDRINFGDNPVYTTSTLHGHEQARGLLSGKRVYDIYVLNTLDPNSGNAFSDLALRFCESQFYLNLLLIGDSKSLEEQIQAARELGAKIRVYRHVTGNGYVSDNNNLTLEGILSSQTH